jgi:DNA-binding response OmpR family regulator
VTRQVLVVDDDALTLEILRTILDLEDFDVRTATDGPSALAAVREERPDVVVLDVMMPGMSGLDVCAELRSEPATKDLPIILLTARDADADRKSGLESGADAYLTKPFSPLKLIATIAEIDRPDPAAGGSA